jgi:hypothetical protein
MIAKLWFNSIFPPPADDQDVRINVTNGSVLVPKPAEAPTDVYSNLMVISASLALGIILGFTITTVWGRIWTLLFSMCETRGDENKETKENKEKKKRARDIGAFTAKPNDPEMDSSAGDV